MMHTILNAIAIAAAFAVCFALWDALRKRKGKDTPEQERPPEAVCDTIERPAALPAAPAAEEERKEPDSETAGPVFVRTFETENKALKRAMQHYAEERRKVKRWKHFAIHAKKARTRKKYARKIRLYLERHPARRGYLFLPSQYEIFGAVYTAGTTPPEPEPGPEGAGYWWSRTPRVPYYNPANPFGYINAGRL